MGFFTEFLKHPLKTGAVIPSGSFLVRAMLAPINFSTATTILELGPGEGCVTRAILSQMSSRAKLYVFETNEEFATRLNVIADPRMTVRRESAEHIRAFCEERRISPDYILSSLPLGSLPTPLVHTIISHAAHLAPKKFIQFQYTRRREKVLADSFLLTKKFIPLNIPPATVYCCTPKLY